MPAHIPGARRHGDAAIWINLVLILSQWFYAKEFVGLIGYAGMAGSVGSLLATVPLTAWISASGWRLPFFVTGILLLASTVMLYAVLIRLPQKREGGAHAHAKVRHSFDVREVGSVSGFANTGGFLSAVLLPSLFGKVLDHFNAADAAGYHYGFLIPAFFSLFGVLGTVMIRETAHSSCPFE